MIRSFSSNFFKKSQFQSIARPFVSRSYQRSNNSNGNSRQNFTFPKSTAAFALISLAASGVAFETDGSEEDYIRKVNDNLPAIRKAIEDIIEDENGTYDQHGSYGPILVRLAWHCSGTYDAATGTGGSNGATMRFKEEAGHGANNGLKIARDRLEVVKKQFPFISYADLWTLAGIVSIEYMGGPSIPWRAGRSDYSSKQYYVVPEGRLPDGAKGASHVRDIFYRMGFNDREITALIGAHALGKNHVDRSGFDGPWTRSPTTFSNSFYQVLLDEKWSWRKWDGPAQYENAQKDLMMLPADYAFFLDPKFKAISEEYARNEDVFFKDFSAAFSKLIELGVPFSK